MTPTNTPTPLNPTCASDGCGRPASIYFEKGGVGSHYCSGCGMRIQSLRSNTPAPKDQMQLVWVQNLIGMIEGTFHPTDRWNAIFIEQLSKLPAPPRVDPAPASEAAEVGSEEWQPIETAPKDGDLFLAWGAGGVPYVTSYLGENHFSKLGSKKPAPTHWCPLPSPPQEPRHD